MEEQIREAIELLDHSNPDHWDARTGKPKLSVVRSLVGEDTISREQVESVSGGLVRQSSQGGEASADAPAPTPETDREAAAQELRETITKLEAEKRAAIERQVQAKADADEAARKMSEARAAFNSRFPPLTEAQKHKLWTQRNLEERRKEVERQHAMAAMTVDARSPLDRALSSRRSSERMPQSASPPIPNVRSTGGQFAGLGGSK